MENRNKNGGNLLNSINDCGIIKVSDGWVACPICKRNKKLLRVTPETTAKHLPVWCRDCKSEIILDIEGQSVKRRSQ